jgi:transcriptional regulator with XRE-family HTH domain
MTKKRPSFSNEIRRLVQDSGLSQYAICKSTGIQPATMNRFMHGKAGLSLENLDRLAEFFGWTITAEQQSSRKPRK